MLSCLGESQLDYEPKCELNVSLSSCKSWVSQRQEGDKHSGKLPLLSLHIENVPFHSCPIAYLLTPINVSFDGRDI